MRSEEEEEEGGRSREKSVFGDRELEGVDVGAWGCLDGI